MCKDRTTKWGFGKSIKKKEYETIIQEQSKHDQQRPIYIRGREVKQRDLNRYLKRRKVDACPARQHPDSGVDNCRDEFGKDESSTVDNSPRQSLSLDSDYIQQPETEGT
jgi:hypothetical protein